MKRRSLIILCLFFLPLFATDALSDTIQIVYIERPPFYFTENNEVRGILADLTQQIFEMALVPHSWKSFPPQRVMHLFRNTTIKICSPGWFYKPERRAYAVFTHAIYQQKPLAILILRDKRSAFAGYDSLSSLFKDRSMTMGTVATYRYSDYIDKLIKRYRPKQLQVSSSATQLVKMILADRVHYIIIAPVEADFLVARTGLDISRFALQTYPDIPPGNRRYLMCSQSVEASTIKRLNEAIEQVVPSKIWSE